MTTFSRHEWYQNAEETRTKIENHVHVAKWDMSLNFQKPQPTVPHLLIKA